MKREFSGEYQSFRCGVAADCGSLPAVRVEGLRKKRLFFRPPFCAKEELSETHAEPLSRSFCKSPHVCVGLAWADVRHFGEKGKFVKLWSAYK